jgi:hypothetical protein
MSTTALPHSEQPEGRILNHFQNNKLLYEFSPDREVFYTSRFNFLAPTCAF